MFGRLLRHVASVVIALSCFRPSAAVVGVLFWGHLSPLRMGQYAVEEQLCVSHVVKDASDVWGTWPYLRPTGGGGIAARHIHR